VRVEQHTLAANQRTEFRIPGRFFLLIEADAPIDVELRRNKSQLRDKAENVVAGYKAFPGDWADPDDNTFDEFVLTSATAQTVTVGVSESAGDYSFLLALVKIQQPTTQDNIVQKSVTTIQTVVAQNLARKRVHLQNTHATLNARIGGIGLTATSGLQLRPGVPFVTDNTGGWNAISESGAAVTIAVLEET